MSFPRYESYRDSGIDWLGKVPSHWSVEPLKHRFDIFGGSTPRSEEPSYWDGDIPWITPADLSGLETVYTSHTRRKITPSGLKSCGTTLVPAGTVILSTRAPIGSLAITTSDACTNQGCKALVSKGSVSAEFLTYLLRVAAPELTIRGRGTTFLELSSDELGSFRIPVPGKAEQSRIVAFLDFETAKIDRLVGAQQRLIELLGEKRQAAISHAVTKGLDPTAPLKPSGVEWLGDVPRHWEVKRLKQVAVIQTGVAKGKDVTGHSVTTVPYLRVANVQAGKLDLTDVAEIDLPNRDVDRYLLRSGDVLMNEGGDFDKLGRGDVWDAQIDPCVHQNHVFAVRPHGMPSKWLAILTGATYARFYFIGRSKQSTNLASISSTNLMELPVTLPPSHELDEIMQHLGRHAAKLNALISEGEMAILLLSERRAALISAAVTGKIDVRSAVKGNPETVEAEAA